MTPVYETSMPAAATAPQTLQPTAPVPAEKPAPQPQAEDQPEDLLSSLQDDDPNS